MLFHSWPVTGRTPPHLLLQFSVRGRVDGFFAISGFLIAASWLRDPKLRDFLTARALRILPGLYVCRSSRRLRSPRSAWRFRVVRPRNYCSPARHSTMS